MEISTTQQLDAFTQKRFELMIDMATKKLQQEMIALKGHVILLNSEIGSLKSQISRLQFQPQQTQTSDRPLVEPQPENQSIQPKKEIKIVDCRPENERRGEFKSGSAQNAEPIRPRYGDYKPEDVSIDKFFYFGRK